MRDFFLNPFHGLFMAAALLVLSTFAHSQQTIHIPADQPTIQSAIDASAPGDTLLVAPGTYLENLDFHGKAITLQSAEGPATTILDGRHLAPTVSFTNGEPRATTLIGFTIRNGAPAPTTPAQPAPHGAGILLEASSPTLTGNILTDNLCAAIDATASAPLIQSNQITRTHVTPACLAQAIAPIVLTGSMSGQTATLLHNTVESNDLTGSQIQPNAGAIALLATPALLQGNILRLNIVPGDAPSGIQILATPGGPTPTLIEQNLIYANTTHCGAAGLSISILNAPDTISHLELQILNNTIADNLTDTTCPTTQPSEVLLAPGALPSQILFANNILSTTAPHTVLDCTTPLPQQMFHHNLLHNPNAPAFSNTCPDSGANILQDPRFKDRAQSDYHLLLASPAVDAGSDTVAAMLPTKDLDQTPRLQNATDKPTTIIDFGAYEYPAAHDLAATTTILNATLSPSEAFQTVTLTTQVTTSNKTPTGSVTLTAQAPGAANITLATLPLDSTGKASYTTSSLPTGPWTLLATYTGTDTLAPSTSAPMLEVVNPATTVLAFSLTPSTAPLGQTITATATLTAPLSTHTPTGPIQFFDLTPTTPVLLGPATLDPRGHATLTLPAMSPGTHRIMAVYPGTPDFTPSNLPVADALLLTIGAADFTLTPTAASITVQTLHHVPDPMALASLGTFADTVTLSCTNLPAAASCTFAPATAPLTAGAKATMVLTLDTSVIHNFYALTQPNPTPFTLATTFPLTLLLLLGRPLTPKARRKLTLLAAMLPLLIFTGCGAGKYPDHTSPGTYQINVVATAATTGISHTTQLTLVVTE